MPRGTGSWGMADFHIHSSLGDGTANIGELLDYVARRTELDIISITDHDDIEGSCRARDLAEQEGYSFQVVIGMEVSTLGGHLLALYIEKPVMSFQPLGETIQAIHEQGGLCVVPHPMSWLTRSVGQQALDNLTRQGGCLDGMEVINPSVAGRVSYHKAKELNDKRYHLAETGGSDAHFLEETGSAYTLFQGHSAQELRHCLEERTTRAGGGKPVPGSTIGYGNIARQQIRSLLVLPARSLSRPLRRLFKGARP
ncbi:MAG: phosphotransferase [Chloroflexi bacterium]|nr:phosphotransferase [Chloroflexota bacterium]